MSLLLCFLATTAGCDSGNSGQSRPLTEAEFRSDILDEVFRIPGGSGRARFEIDSSGTIFVNDGCNDQQFSPWIFEDGELKLADDHEGFGTERGCPEGQGVSALPLGVWVVVEVDGPSLTILSDRGEEAPLEIRT